MSHDIDIGALRTAAGQGHVHWHQHALERLLERGFSRAQIIEAIMKGEVIESYPTDRPYPSCLILKSGEEPLHVVAAIDAAGNICHVITVYEPDLEHFEPDLKTRRKPL